MTMNVSKGEFDRRVKLLEQQVRTTTNDLINRLQAESEYYIEQLKNTNLNIDELKKEIEEGGGTEEIERKLNDLVSSYNNFKANTLRINDVFDADGQFDGSKIRPLSIETAALSVGQRSQQLALNGIEFKLDPYGTSGGGILYWKSTSNNSTISSSNIAGIMFHYGYGTETNPKIYKIMEGSKSFTSNDILKGFYIYAKIKKSSSTTAIYTEPTTVTKEYFDGYFEMLYDSNHTKIYNNTLPLFDSNADYYIYVNNKYEKIIITNSNFRKNLVGLYKKVGDSYQLVLQDQPVYNSSTTYCTKKDETLPEESSSSSSYNGETITFNNVATIIVTTEQFTYDGTNKTSGGTSDSGYFYIQLGYVSVELNKGTTNNAYYRKVDLTYGSTTINGRLITTGRIEGGTGTNPAYFDLDTGEIGGKIVFNDNNKSSLTSVLNNEYDLKDAANTAYNNATAYTNGQISTREEAGWQVKTQKIYIAVPGVGTGSSKPNTPIAPNYIVTENYDVANTWSKKIPENTNNGGWHYFSCTQSWKEKNNSTKELNNSSVIYEETLTILATAIRGTTTIAGGLVLTQVVKAGSGNNSSVLDGTNSQYGYWTGSDLASSAPARIYKNGKAYFSDLEINNSYFKIKNEKLDFDPTSSAHFYTYIRNSGGSDGSSYVGNVSLACDTAIRFTKSSSFNSSSYDYGIAVKYNKTQGGSTSTVSQFFWVTNSQTLVNGGSQQTNSIVQVRFFRIKKNSHSFTIGNNGFILNSLTTSGFYIYLCIGASTGYSVRNAIISFNAYNSDLMYVYKDLLS